MTHTKCKTCVQIIRKYKHFAPHTEGNLRVSFCEFAWSVRSHSNVVGIFVRILFPNPSQVGSSFSLAHRRRAGTGTGRNTTHYTSACCVSAVPDRPDVSHRGGNLRPPEASPPRMLHGMLVFLVSRTGQTSPIGGET